VAAPSSCSRTSSRLGRHGLRGRNGADETLASLPGDRRVDDGPPPSQLQHRRRRPREGLHLLLRQRLAAQRDLPVEGEQRIAAEHALDELPVALGRRAVERGSRLEVATEAAGPQDVDADLAQRADYEVAAAGVGFVHPLERP
jgi:hypothetical protein